MLRPASNLLAIVMALASVEGMAYWWMHPTPSGIGQPVLCYRPDPSRSGGVPPASSPDDPQSSIHDPQSPIPDPQSSSDSPSPTSTFTLLPEIATRSLPRLSATNGTVARIDRDDGTTIHVAFFEWDHSDSDPNAVMQAFIHLPEECLGHIGMKLISHQPPHAYQVDGETLTFDHTIFRIPGGPIVHAFKCTWVSGTKSLLGNGVRGGMAQWHQLHMKAARNRFLPAHARVAQGAVSGIPDPDQAWQAFQAAMLEDLKFETR